jgi:hypothetical protein
MADRQARERLVEQDIGELAERDRADETAGRAAFQPGMAVIQDAIAR